MSRCERNAPLSGVVFVNRQKPRNLAASVRQRLDLERIWLGHASEEVGDLYSKLKEDFAFRQQWAERIGLGFELVHNGPQNVASAERQKVA